MRVHENDYRHDTLPAIKIATVHTTTEECSLESAEIDFSSLPQSLSAPRLYKGDCTLLRNAEKKGTPVQGGTSVASKQSLTDRSHDDNDEHT